MRMNSSKSKKLRSVSGTSYGTTFNKAMLVHFQVRFPGKQGRHFYESDIFCVSLFLHHRAKQAIHLTAFVKVQFSMRNEVKFHTGNLYGAQQNLKLNLH